MEGEGLTAGLPGIEGRVALVTGGNHGIGAAVARALARSGAAVLVTFLRSGDPPDQGQGLPDRYRLDRERDAAEVVGAVRGDGGQAVAVEADLLDPATPALLFDRAEAELGPVDVLVNNASGWVADTFTPAAADRFDRRLQPVSAATFDRQFGVDARAAALLIAELARRHAARGATWGRIVGLTSGGPGGFPQEVSYGAAKAALENYTMSAASELAPLGITANIVHPPVTDTGWITPAVAAVATRVAHPDDVAEVVTYLCSDLARTITGNRLHLR